MKIKLEIEQKDLRDMYEAFKFLRATSWSVQDYTIQVKMAEQEKRIKELVEPLIKGMDL